MKLRTKYLILIFLTLRISCFSNGNLDSLFVVAKKMLLEQVKINNKNDREGRSLQNKYMVLIEGDSVFFQNENYVSNPNQYVVESGDAGNILSASEINASQNKLSDFHVRRIGKAVKIKFRIKNKITPLSTRPSFVGMFRFTKNRTYIITISKKSISFLDTILLCNLNYNAQIGVLGHELSHVSDFNSKGFGSMCRVVIGHLSKKYVDSFEFITDRACIDHGLGYQLLAWSINVRENLKSTSWLGAANMPPDSISERYMNPGTIERILLMHTMYQSQ